MNTQDIPEFSSDKINTDTVGVAYTSTRSRFVKLEDRHQVEPVELSGALQEQHSNYSVRLAFELSHGIDHVGVLRNVTQGPDITAVEHSIKCV